MCNQVFLNNDNSIHVPAIDEQLVVTFHQFPTVQIMVATRNRSSTFNPLTIDALFYTKIRPNGNIAILFITLIYFFYLVYIGVNALMRSSQDIVILSINVGLHLDDNVIYASTVVLVINRRHLRHPVLLVSLDGSHYFSTVTAVISCLLLIKSCKVIRFVSSCPAIESVRERDPCGHETLWIRSLVALFNETLSTDFNTVNQWYVSVTPIQMDLIAKAALLVLSDRLVDTEGLASW